MCDNKNPVSINDYAQLTAQTGIKKVAVANPSLNGSGDLAALITGKSNGTRINSIIIKAVQNTTIGMVRLFIGKDNPLTDIVLYQEITIPQSPELSSTPYPLPTLPKLEIVVSGEGFILKPGYVLYASTQNSETFNILVEGVDASYPAVLPSACCTHQQDTGELGIGTISLPNPNLDGSGDIKPIYTVSQDNGAIVKSITIKALGSTREGMVRLFIKNNTQYFLFKEVYIPVSNQSSFQPSFVQVVVSNYYLQSGCTIGASTQNNDEFSIIVEGTGWAYPG